MTKKIIAVLFYLCVVCVNCNEEKSNADDDEDIRECGMIVQPFCGDFSGPGEECLDVCEKNWNDCLSQCLEAHPDESECESYCEDLGYGLSRCEGECYDNYPFKYCNDTPPGDCTACAYECCALDCGEKDYNTCLNVCAGEYDPGVDLISCCDDCKDVFYQCVETCG